LLLLLLLPLLVMKETLMERFYKNTKEYFRLVTDITFPSSTHMRVKMFDRREE
jgi:hypothetical protein